MGLLLDVVIHRADIQDRHGARYLLSGVRLRHPRLEVVWVDQGYSGVAFAYEIAAREHVRLEQIVRPPGQKGFAVLPRRWVVERTFAWLGKCRRLSKDYEQLMESSKAFVLIAMIKLMARRLAS